MRTFTDCVGIDTTENIEFIDVTWKIKNIINKSGIKDGIVNIYPHHTTTAIRINENEPLLIEDLKCFLEREVPSTKRYNHDDVDRRAGCPEHEPRNAHSHIKSFLLGTSETIPIVNEQLPLGKWQSVFFVELDGPRKRKMTVHVLGI